VIDLRQHAGRDTEASHQLVVLLKHTYKKEITSKDESSLSYRGGHGDELDRLADVFADGVPDLLCGGQLGANDGDRLVEAKLRIHQERTSELEATSK